MIEYGALSKEAQAIVDNELEAVGGEALLLRNCFGQDDLPLGKRIVMFGQSMASKQVSLISLKHLLLKASARCFVRAYVSKKRCALEEAAMWFMQQTEKDHVSIFPCTLTSVAGNCGNGLDRESLIILAKMGQAFNGSGSTVGEFRISFGRTSCEWVEVQKKIESMVF